MIKTVPPSTLENVVPPNLKFLYFEDWRDHPFEASATRFSLVNAWWLSECAFIAYADRSFVQETLKKQNLKFQVTSFEKTETECFAFSTDDFAVLSFRGTEANNFIGAVKDWVTDFRAQLQRDGQGSGIHEGFVEALERVWKDVTRYVRKLNGNKPKPIWITGHSLGAALATLAAYRANAEGLFPVQGCYTYGSPRVGDSVFAANFAKNGLSKRTFRLVNNIDIIPKLPPEDLNYKHVGNLKFLDNTGHLADVQDVVHLAASGGMPSIFDFFSTFRVLSKPNEPLLMRVPGFIADHAPLFYSIHVWNNLVATS